MTRKSKKLGVKTSKSAVFDDDSFEVNSTANETSEDVEPDSEENEKLTKEEKAKSSSAELAKLCSVLDRLTLDMLVLMERQMQYKLNIESSMTDGELHIAKCRYIMGHKSVSSLQLPTENGPDIDASVTVEEIQDDPAMFGKPRLKMNIEEFQKATSNSSDDSGDAVKQIQDPVNWFGVLVPRDLRLAQSKFQHALDWAVTCANNQIRLHQTHVKIKQLTELKHQMQQSTTTDE